MNWQDGKQITTTKQHKRKARVNGLIKGDNMNAPTVHQRVRRRNLKEGRVFICATEGGVNHPTHTCPAGDPIIIDTILSKSATCNDIPVAVAGKFITRDGKPTIHCFRLCDLRLATAEDWA